ncbi:MAG: hypothetical protein U9R47_10910 [Actinomycetota bacterium]|nr:hypothetical protein [Actinomycetota bacterium]
MTDRVRPAALDTKQRLAALVVLALCATSVGALLADLYGLIPMDEFVLWVTLPALLLLVAMSARTVPAYANLQRRIRLGAVAGVAGTLAYDVFRIPFALAGQRIFAPIYSYGLLIDGGGMSSPWTDLLGWLFHFSNGVTFGIIYAVVMAGRFWGFGVLWGVLLEAVAFLSPFTDIYGLTGKWVAIGIALAAHVAYGLPLGLMVDRFDRTERFLKKNLIYPTALVIGVSIIGLTLWHRPWSDPAALERAQDLSAGAGQPVAVVSVERFEPEWLRIEPGGCILVASDSTRSFTSDFGPLPAGEHVEWCFPDAGVQRVKLDDRPYSGGFVFVHDR